MSSISFNEFERIMKNIVAIYDLDSKISKATRIYNKKTGDYTSFVLPSNITDTIDLLQKITDDAGEWISYWVFELDCGKAYEDGMVTEADGTNIKLSSISDLWNMLSSNKNCSSR